MSLQIAIGRLERFAAECGAPVVRSSLMTQLLGQVKEGRIVLRKGLSLEQQLLTLVHELTHLIIHCHANPPIHRTVCEYEAEAVERWVGVVLKLHSATEDFDSSEFTDDLLACSVSRVRRAARSLLNVVRGTAPAIAAQSLEPQATVQIDASTGEEVVFNDE